MKRDLDYMISVMTAAREGKVIEYTSCGRNEWAITIPAWNWVEFDYRVKREPKEIWVNEFSDGSGGGNRPWPCAWCAGL